MLYAVRRDVEVHPVEHEGQPFFVLQDVEGLAPDPIGVPPGGLAVAGLFDGKRTAEEVAELLFKETGQRVPAAEITALHAELEKAGMLETPAVAEARKKLWEEFKKSPTRKAVHMGRGGYPADRLELAAYVGKFFSSPPGKPSGAPLKGLFAPHIDLARGGRSYAHAYKALAETPPPDVILALGVAHMSPNSPWTFTRKQYETPNGPMAVDVELYEELARALWYDPTDDEWVHRREHSLEFQALWLRYIWKDATPPWVPVLCSTFERWAADKPPSAVPTVEEALRKMRGVIEKRGRVLILAGVDLAHVGPHFGDELKLGPELEKRVKDEDAKSLELALAGQADAMYSSVVADEHWRKWCGLSAAYTALRLLGGKGELLDYGQAPDPRGGLVSFASAAFR